MRVNGRNLDDPTYLRRGGDLQTQIDDDRPRKKGVPEQVPAGGKDNLDIPTYLRVCLD